MENRPEICRNADSWPFWSNFSLLSHFQGIVNFYTQILDGAFQFGMPKKQLDCPQILRSAINQRRFRSSQRVCAVGGWIEVNLRYPIFNNASILPC